MSLKKTAFFLPRAMVLCFFLCVLPACPLKLQPKVSPTASEGGECQQNVVRRAIFDGQMNLLDCQAVESYQFDVTQFSPEIEPGLDPSQGVLETCEYFDDRELCVTASLYQFSTREAVLNDPSARMHLSAYQSVEYRAILSLGDNQYLFAISDLSLSDAFRKAAQKCKRRGESS